MPSKNGFGPVCSVSFICWSVGNWWSLKEVKTLGNPSERYQDTNISNSNSWNVWTTVCGRSNYFVNIDLGVCFEFCLQLISSDNATALTPFLQHWPLCVPPKCKYAFSVWNWVDFYRVFPLHNGSSFHFQGWGFAKNITLHMKVMTDYQTTVFLILGVLSRHTFFIDFI